LSQDRSRAAHWNQVARVWHLKGYSNKLLAEYWRKAHLSLIARWVDIANAGRILKTDLFAEAFGLQQFLFDIAQSNGDIVGIDVSNEVVIRAKQTAQRHGVDSSSYICCDVKQLPLQDNSIDLIISDSTLDHLPSEVEITAALRELTRILRVGGILILTMDNKSNLTYPPYPVIRLWMRLGLAPYFIGRTLSPAKLRRTLNEIGFDIEEVTAILHYPHPDALVRWSEHTLRTLGRGKLDNTVRKCLELLDKLESKRTKFLTGRYISVKAVKRGAQ
jgi:SAM-dependent methyltransferase